MMKKISQVCLMLLAGLFSFAQQSVSVEGKVIGSLEQVVPNAKIEILNTNYFATSNIDGSFSLKNIANGNYIIKISASDYATFAQKITITDTADKTFVFQLKNKENQLDEVIVSAQKRDENQQNIPLSISTLSDKDIKKYKIWDIKDITAIVPNLYVSNPGDNRNITSIRGIGIGA